MRPLLAFAGSLTGRIFLVLLIGTAAAAFLSLSLAGLRQQADITAFQHERTADRIQAYINLRQRIGVQEARALAARGATSVHLAPADTGDRRPDQGLNQVLDKRFGAAQTTAYQVHPQLCERPRIDLEAKDEQADAAVKMRAASLGLTPPSCWAVEIRAADGVEHLLVGAPPRLVHARLVDPIFVGALIIAAALLSFIVAQIAARPLRHMSAGAQALGDSLEVPPMAEDGPLEVRRAAQAMNSLQHRLKLSLAAQRQILAAVTHDIQTPMTRMRLRLEKVGDTELRDRLLGDLGAMQALAREGLEIARDAPSQEPLAVLALDSLMESLADDERDAGRDVRFLSGCGCDVEVRPQGLKRCVANLIDNAVRYGERALISTEERNGQVVVVIEDDGPGIPERDLASVMEPFVRLETSRSRDTGGTGLGLAIASRLARGMGAELTLSNRPSGGLRAALTLRRASSAA